VSFVLTYIPHPSLPLSRVSTGDAVLYVVHGLQAYRVLVCVALPSTWKACMRAYSAAIWQLLKLSCSCGCAVRSS